MKREKLLKIAEMYENEKPLVKKLSNRIRYSEEEQAAIATAALLVETKILTVKQAAARFRVLFPWRKDKAVRSLINGKLNCSQGN